MRLENKNGIYALPCGVDYPKEVVRGLIERLGSDRPEALARCEIIVNTSRMRKDIFAAFKDGPPRLLPKITLLSEIGLRPDFVQIPHPESALTLRLTLSQLVAKFLEREPKFAIRSASFELATNLARLLAEMEEEGVTAEDIAALEVPDISGHWEKSLAFLKIAFSLLQSDGETITSEGRLVQMVKTLSENWAARPPDHPIILAGTTGSRRTTSMLIEAVSKLPQGAVILPGFDFEIGEDVWSRLQKDQIEEHPQARFAQIARLLDINHEQIFPWTQWQPTARNRLLSLALCPAPVTDKWMREQEASHDLSAATDKVSLIEAPDPRCEANAIALLMRQAVHDEKRIALITPDRDLARRVTAQLRRWNITPDDSAGVPLNQTPPGRLLRHVSSGMGHRLSAEELIILLKHPLCARGGTEEMRGFHLLWTRELEVYLRRKGIAHPLLEHLENWAQLSQRDSEPETARPEWVSWIESFMAQFEPPNHASVSQHLERMIAISELLTQGHKGTLADELWAQNAGRAAFKLVHDLKVAAQTAAEISVSEFAQIFRTLISSEMTRDPMPTHPNVMIWGTLEARALGADRVILAGLNETIWPKHPEVDPWFNRSLRKAAGLMSPERQIGLSAHDFQQAVAAKEVILSRAIRDMETETVPSRWVLRLTNLLSGLSTDSETALSEMRARGQIWIDYARQLDRPHTQMPKAVRPSPMPPVDARPRQLSVTQIETLIRDPYEIYAKRILRLQKLDPFRRTPDVRDRGTVLHLIIERFLERALTADPDIERARLLSVAETTLEETVPWKAARRIWLARVRRVSERLIAREYERASQGQLIDCEVSGQMHLPKLDFSLTAKADRIDRAQDGTLILYDYKSGEPPSAAQAETFNVQLYLEALIAKAGGFDKISPEIASQAAFLGLKETLKEVTLDIGPEKTEEIYAKFTGLIARYNDESLGYTARRALFKTAFTSDFDHLSRFGEWAESDAPTPEEVT